jgi:PAS domain S-box-containing protein
MITTPPIYSGITKEKSKISKEEYSVIERKWLGATFITPGYLKYMGIVLVVIGGAFFLLLVFSLILRKQVKVKTSELIKTNLLLKEEIRERETAEWSIRESEWYLASILESNPTGTIIVEKETRKIIYVNKTAAGMIGLTKEEIMDRVCHLFICPAEEKSCPVNDLGQTVDRPEKVLLQGDGQRVPILKTVVPITIKGKECLLESFIDITERKRFDQEKKSLQEQLGQAQKMEAMRTLAGGIAHDFNNILLAIIGYTQLAIDDVSDTEKARRELKEVLKAGDRAKDIVQQILAFSRKADVTYSPIALRGTIADSLKMIRSMIPTTIEIRQNLVDSGLVMSSLTQINQIVMNLCTNAAHAMDGGSGVLEVSLKRVALTESSWSRDLNLSPGSYLRLSVSDTGHGMSPEVIARIFEPYFTTKELGRGTGLGLSVVHGIVKSHGGAIFPKSTPGEGTTFDIYLPEIESGESSSEPHHEIHWPRGKEKILFIDDEPVLTELAGIMLRKLGYNVVTETSSIEALNLFRKNPDGYNLVITDMTMPGMTGDKLALVLLDIRSDIPIILCTGYSEHISEERAKSLGIREFIMKPFEVEILAKGIRKVLDGG